MHYNNTNHKGFSITSISNTLWWCFDDRKQKGQSDWAPTRGHHGGWCVDIVFPVPQLTTVFNNVLTMYLPTYLSWHLVGEEGSRRVRQLGVHHNGVITDMSLTSPPVINIKNWHNLNLQESLCYDSYQNLNYFSPFEMGWHECFFLHKKRTKRLMKRRHQQQFLTANSVTCWYLDRLCSGHKPYVCMKYSLPKNTRECGFSHTKFASWHIPKPSPEP